MLVLIPPPVHVPPLRADCTSPATPVYADPFHDPAGVPPTISALFATSSVLLFVTVIGPLMRLTPPPAASWVVPLLMCNCPSSGMRLRFSDPAPLTNNPPAGDGWRFDIVSD